MNFFISIFRNAGGLILGTILGALLVELILQTLPTVDMRPVFDNKLPVNYLTPDSDYTFSRGWNFFNPRRGTINNYGFVASFDYRPGTPIVMVIGDSFIQSLMNDHVETLQGYMGRALDMPVYNVSGRGFSIADYLVAAEFAAAEFDVEKIVILLTRGDIEESYMSTGRGAHIFEIGNGRTSVNRRSGAYGSFGKLLFDASQYSATVRYLSRNLKLQVRVAEIGRDICLKFGLCNEPSQPEPGKSKAAADFFLEQLLLRTGMAAGDIVLLLDSDRERIYAGLGTAPEPSIQYFSKSAQAAGFAVVDMDIVFRAHFEKNRLRVDYTPFDIHWNALGHRLAAEAAMRQIRLTQ